MVKFVWLLAAGFIVVAGHAAPTGAAEQRCTELGANCYCSEPLNTSSYQPATDPFFNPSDSSTKQCPGEMGDGASVTFSDFTPIAETLMPAGNAVTWVLKQTGNNLHVNSGLPTSSAQRVCARVYQNFTSDYQGKGEGGCTNNKSIWLPWYQSGSQSYLEQGGGASKFHITIYGFSALGGTNITGTGSELDHHDCVSQWCRFETCVSGNVRAGTNLTIDGEIVALKDGRKQTFPPTFLGNATEPARFATPYLGYRQDSCAGTRSVSHVMVAEWGTAAGQRIGKAYEVEGGTGGGTPTPAAPAPPVLLP